MYVHASRITKEINNQTEKFVEFEFVGLQNRGWAGFTLSTNNSLENSISFIGYHPDKIIFLTNHTTVESLDKIDSFVYVRNFNYRFDGIMSFKVTLNESMILGKNKITIGQNYNFLPTWTNETTISKHSGVSSYLNFQLDLPEHKYPFCNDNLNLPGRILAMHWSIYLASAFILSFFGLFFVYFRNEQPLKSRFVGPLYCIIGTHLDLIGEFIFGLFPYEQSAYWVCSYYAFFLYAAIQFSLMIPCLMSIRYAILLQLHFYKRNYIKKHKLLRKTSSMSIVSSNTPSSFSSNSQIFQETSLLRKIWKRLRDFLSMLKSPWIFVVVPIIWGLIFLVAEFVVFTASGFRCSSFARTFFRYTHVGFIFTSFIVLTAFVSLDFVLSVRRWCKWQWHIYLFEEDPFNYRVDMMMFGFFFFPVVIIWATLPLPKLISAAVVDYLMILAVILSGGNALLITMFKRIKFYIQTSFNERNESNNKNRVKLTPEMILSEQRLLEIFIKFADFEWSSENIYFVLDVNQYKNQKDLKTKRALATQIKENYFIPNVSPLELNITGKSLKTCMKFIEENEFTNELFNSVQDEVEVNICDTISRFIVSDEYKEYKKYDYERLSSLGL
eukprot:gene12432-6184_t